MSAEPRPAADRSDAPVEFCWLGVPVRFETDDPELLRVVRRLWGEADSEARATRREYRALLHDGGAPRIECPDGEVALDTESGPLHAYNVLVSDLFGVISDRFVFHGTAVAGSSGALIVSGPTTFGKTTLGIHLAQRGFELLADDMTVLERGSGRVHPFRRPVNLRPGTRATLDPERLEAAREATIDVDGGEWAVGPDPWPRRTTPAERVQMVVILRTRDDVGTTRRFPWYEIRLVAGSAELRDELSGLSCIEQVETSDDDPWFLRLSTSRPAELIRWLGAHGERVVSAIKAPGGKPDFTRPPELHRIGKFQAAVELAQEMLNRHDGSVVAREFEGRLPELVGEIAELLRDAHCYALAAGPLDATLELVIDTYRETEG